jgi:hypothetical protein
VHILEVFFGLLGMTFGAIHIRKSLPKVHQGIGMGVTIHTRQLPHLVHILSPFFGVHIQRPNRAIPKDLGKVKIPVAHKTFLVRIFMHVGRGMEGNRESKKAKEKKVTRPPFSHHLQ